jgi:glyoxylase-like metal-dependent hydrolase (beta-lactamase superfamily II)
MMKKWTTKHGYQIIQILSGRSNVFLLTNGKTKFLIDTSVSRLWQKLQKRLDKAGVSNIDYLILTHAHFDHAANANKIKATYRASVLVQKSEADYLAKGDHIIPQGTTLLTRPLVNLAGRRFLKRVRYEPCQYDILVDNLLDLNDLGINACIMHTPGHTSGSISVIVDDEIAIVGDTMFGVFGGSVFPPFAENVLQMIQSWGKLLQTNCKVFIPSHGTANSRSLVEKDYVKRVQGL